MNPREEIITLLRGQVACPVISMLGEMGWLEAMTDHGFHCGSFPGSINAEVFRSVMDYLVSLQLVENCETPRTYRATALGQSVFKRYGAFCILNSYEPYMRGLASMLIPDGSARPQVDRRRNVVGSGALHSRKFFRDAMEMLRGDCFGVIADVGCGDGQFLSHCLERYPTARVWAVDISPVAVEQTLHRFREQAVGSQVEGVVSDGADLDKWTACLPKDAQGSGRILISCWFLLHEISRGQAQVVIDYFVRLHALCPRATVVVGELVQCSRETLALNRAGSILPELMLLHDLSRQGLLSWQQWKDVAAAIPYKLADERLFDVVSTESSEFVPSSFVWRLESK